MKQLKKKQVKEEPIELFSPAKENEFAGLYNINQAGKQLIDLYDNLAVYSDYLMRLTQHQDGKITKSSDRNKLFNRGNAAGLELVKKSNDIKGNNS